MNLNSIRATVSNMLPGLRPLYPQYMMEGNRSTFANQVADLDSSHRDIRPTEITLQGVGIPPEDFLATWLLRGSWSRFRRCELWSGHSSQLVGNVVVAKMPYTRPELLGVYKSGRARDFEINGRIERLVLCTHLILSEPTWRYITSRTDESVPVLAASPIPGRLGAIVDHLVSPLIVAACESVVFIPRYTLNARPNGPIAGRGGEYVYFRNAVLHSVLEPAFETIA